MANLEERVTSLEGQTDKHSVAVDGVRNEMAGLRSDLRGEMDALRTELRGETAGLRAELHGDMAALRTELRSDMGGLRTDVGELSRRSDRFFIWLAGTQVATLLAVIGVLVGILYR